MPSTVITGDQPMGCVDRRPAYTGFPRVRACEFDGRLSLARLRGTFYLFARANLKMGAIAGGRYVQVTTSKRLEDGWAPWQSVQIMGVDPSRMDLYFFAVQANPVDPTSLLAVFPLTEPPWACLALAVSRDGFHFSRPIHLLPSFLGVRSSITARAQTSREGEDHEQLEWRGEDHPAAGIVHSPLQRDQLLLYVHHAVKGTTIRSSAVPHVRAYRLPVSWLAAETREGLKMIARRS